MALVWFILDRLCEKHFIDKSFWWIILTYDKNIKNIQEVHIYKQISIEYLDKVILDVGIYIICSSIVNTWVEISRLFNSSSPISLTFTETLNSTSNLASKQNKRRKEDTVKVVDLSTTSGYCHTTVVISGGATNSSAPLNGVINRHRCSLLLMVVRGVLCSLHFICCNDSSPIGL